jgi:hypothetical protein
MKDCSCAAAIPDKFQHKLTIIELAFCKPQVLVLMRSSGEKSKTLLLVPPSHAETSDLLQCRPQ